MSEDKAAEAQQLDIQKIYLRDVSLETPNSPRVFAEQWNPQIQLQINTGTEALTEALREVVLTLTVTASLGDKTAFLVEVQQAGIFALQGFSEEQLGVILGAFCPGILFPYAREAVDSMVVKAGFPPLMLKPVNFDALYHQHVRSQQDPPQPVPEAKH
jgi:preprotein translocase subunit SecB